MFYGLANKARVVVSALVVTWLYLCEAFMTYKNI